MWQSHCVKPKTKLNLVSIDTGGTDGFKGDKEEAEVYLKELRGRLNHLQELLYAEGKHKILIVLQAMDTGGKDGTIRSIFEGINPQGVDVKRFKTPSEEELAHDYLWRVHEQVPECGKITIFNRSHYEDVVIVSVHDLVDPLIVEKRFAQINDFERMLSEEGTVVLKFFLHISKEEQRKRIKERLDDPKKHWKFTLGDVRERKSWDKYITAYEKAIALTTSTWAPWCVVPSDKKWYRNLVVAEAIVERLEFLNMKYPKLLIDPKKVYFK